MLQRKELPLPVASSLAESPGVSMAVAVQGLLQAEPSLHELAATVRRHVLQMTPVTLTLSGLGEANGATQALETFCARLRDAGVPASSLIGLCLSAPATPLRAYAFITRCWLGNGPRYVIPGASQMQHLSGKNDEARYWEYLWRHRGTRWAVLPAYGDSVSTPCALLAGENANAVLPTAGLQAPAGSAWLPLRLHLPRFADDNGTVRRQALTRSLVACVDRGERLIDLQSWPTRCMQQDARMNRRIAIQITGIGDLVRMQRADPSNLTVLQSLLELMEHVRTTVWDRSAELARGADLLPAIARHEPALTVPEGQHHVHWAARWHAAVERCAVRHRNLLVISPYAVLPAGGEGCAAYADLLPLIACADAHSFALHGSQQNWQFKDFCRFHRRAWAVMQRRNGVSLIATRA
jgi:hypothetical protein